MNLTLGAGILIQSAIDRKQLVMSESGTFVGQSTVDKAVNLVNLGETVFDKFDSKTGLNPNILASAIFISCIPVSLDGVVLREMLDPQNGCLAYHIPDRAKIQNATSTVIPVRTLNVPTSRFGMSCWKYGEIDCPGKNYIQLLSPIQENVLADVLAIFLAGNL